MAPKSSKDKARARQARNREQRLAAQNQEQVPLPSTPSFRSKLDWASEHIERLETVQETWLRTHAYTTVADREPKTGRVVFKAKITKPPPAELSLILGDAAHALRSTLDHLALELAVAYQRPTQITPAVEKASEFPIFPDKVGNKLGRDAFHVVEQKTGKPARGSGLHKLQGVDPDAIKAIEGIQPYHRGATYIEDPLWVIHELDRVDKHRRLNLTAYAMPSTQIVGGNFYMGNVTFQGTGHGGAVKDGTELLIMTASSDSHFDLKFVREIALAEPGLSDGVFLVPAITDARDYVRDVVVPLLEPWL